MRVSEHLASKVKERSRSRQETAPVQEDRKLSTLSVDQGELVQLESDSSNLHTQEASTEVTSTPPGCGWAPRTRGRTRGRAVPRRTTATRSPAAAAGPQSAGTSPGRSSRSSRRASGVMKIFFSFDIACVRSSAGTGTGAARARS